MGISLPPPQPPPPFPLLGHSPFLLHGYHSRPKHFCRKQCDCKAELPHTAFQASTRGQENTNPNSLKLVSPGDLSACPTPTPGHREGAAVGSAQGKVQVLSPQGFPMQGEKEAAPARVTGTLPPLGLKSHQDLARELAWYGSVLCNAASAHF